MALCTSEKIVSERNMIISSIGAAQINWGAASRSAPAMMITMRMPVTKRVTRIRVRQQPVNPSVIVLLAATR